MVNEMEHLDCAIKQVVSNKAFERSHSSEGFIRYN